jgi:molecular chaperone DnaK
MAAGNKTLGRFELVGIPSAPRGVPQIEVTFDIDANGIVNVSAKDLATGKQQSIQITASSGLSKEEIDRMTKDAELHAEDDKKKRALVDARNTADSLIYSTEKTLKEMEEKLDASTRSRVEEAVSSLKKAMEGEDTAEIQRLTEELTQASHKVAEAMYKQASQAGGGQPGAGAGGGAAGAGGGKADDDIVDADFEEVNEDKK